MYIHTRPVISKAGYRGGVECSKALYPFHFSFEIFIHPLRNKQKISTQLLSIEPSVGASFLQALQCNFLHCYRTTFSIELFFKTVAFHFSWSRGPRMNSRGLRNPCSHICTGELKYTVDRSISRTSGGSP